MTQQQYLEYIQRQLQIIGKDKPLAYQLGFLQAQLANAMNNDSHVAHAFKDSVNTLGYKNTKP